MPAVGNGSMEVSSTKSHGDTGRIFCNFTVPRALLYCRVTVPLCIKELQWSVICCSSSLSRRKWLQSVAGWWRCAPIQTSRLHSLSLIRCAVCIPVPEMFSMNWS